ncbi:MAG: hypothetical protein JXR20_12840 [Balneola sp.]
MRTTVFIFFLVFLVSCSDSPENKLKSLKENWIKSDTTVISVERLKVRFEKALEYVQTHRAHWGMPLDGCYELVTDTLREEKATFKVISTPLRKSNIDRDISFTLDRVWSCEVFKQPFDSLRIQTSSYTSIPSEEQKSIIRYSSETMDEITSWKERNFDVLDDITSSILSTLPSDTESELPALFEVPTGKTIRVHMPSAYHNLNTDWDSLKYLPDQILLDTYSASVAIIFYTNDDMIEKVWWTLWIT